MKALQDRGVDAVIIGDTSVMLALGESVFNGDLDLFVLSHSPLADKSFFEGLARELNWGLSSTEIGTPSLIVPLESETLVVELYENYMDIDIPAEIFEDTIDYRVDGVRVRSIRPEYYLVLKARQGVDLDKLVEYIRVLKRTGLNTKLVEYAASLYPEDEKEVIIERLRSCKLEI
jgi:predicted nucleotidyltransferase